MRTVYVALPLLLFFASASQVHGADAPAGIAVFNHALDQATRRMDDAATLALWEDDGVSLLPATAPMIGKPAIAAFLATLRRQHPGAHMQTFQSHCFDIQRSGDLASEWCEEHQVVSFGAGTTPFDGRGKMLLVLHRGADGRWRLRQEMWNQAAPGPTPPARTR